MGLLDGAEVEAEAVSEGEAEGESEAEIEIVVEAGAEAVFPEDAESPAAEPIVPVEAQPDSSSPPAAATMPTPVQ